MSRPTDRLPCTPPDEHRAAADVRPERARLWPAAAAVVALGLALAFVWSNPKDGEEQRDKHAEERRAAVADRKSYMKSELTLGKAKADLTADWQWEEAKVVIRLNPDIEAPSNYVGISAQGGSDSQEIMPRFPLPLPVAVTLSVQDPPARITVRVALGDQDWQKGETAPSRTLRLSPDGSLFDVSTGKEVPSSFE
ncbi:MULTISPECIES: hypothetical protein [unclassified Streptomyces]|uniref:hypothetical protein n=1 Tax=unclassified Streptomyces TaxID=2593676 RepID=UPI002FC6A6A4|nr:hypothetical protein OG414_41185 [Streptomyces sp. NBC_01174]